MESIYTIDIKYKIAYKTLRRHRQEGPQFWQGVFSFSPYGFKCIRLTVSLTFCWFRQLLFHLFSLMGSPKEPLFRIISN